ncbi:MULTISPECIES: histidine kinase [unclassified Novosphingobium]|uniref:AAA family ATPase n=1 Tax=unclassified Novosphingobium TaxID=2644732 RepID=UPI00135A6ACF|nr:MULTISPECIES: histidine kinase [unclassified Novosphingobium]
MVRIHLLSIDRALAQRITDAMGAHVTVDMAQSLDDATFDGPGIVVIDHASIPAERSMASVIGEVAQAAPGRAVVLATEDMYAVHVLQAIRSGATDVMPRGAVAAEVSEILSRVLNSALASQGRLGRLTLVLGTDRDATAMLATDMALAHSLDGPPTLLIDCTLPSSTAEAYLDLKVDYGLASAITDIDRMDASLLGDALARHERSGLTVLTLDGGTGAEPVGIGPSDIVGLVQLLRASCAHVVLCGGSLRNGGLLRELASQAQSIEVVCSQSIRELDSCRRLLDRVAIDTASAQRLRLLVWDYDPRILLDGRRMADALDIDTMLGVPTDRVRMRNALNAGRPMMIERDGGPYAQAIRRACGISAPTKSNNFGIDKMRKAILRSVERTA